MSILFIQELISGTMLARIILDASILQRPTTRIKTNEKISYSAGVNFFVEC